MEVGDFLNPHRLYGLASPTSPRATAPAGVAAAVSTSGMPEPRLFSPDHPMFWLAGLLLVAFGAAGVSGAVRVGPLKAAASAGKA